MAVVVLGLGAVLAFGVLETGDQIASVISCLVGLAALCVTWLDSRRLGPVAEALEAACGALSAGARERLRQEAATRGLAFPEPLRIPWLSIGGPFAASPDVVLGRLPGVRRTALRLQGDVTTLADTVDALPARQVVITGEAGAGKTSAAILLATQIVREGEVAVLVNLADWDPARQCLTDWIEACLTATRPASVPMKHARAAATCLAERGAIVPILDGLDELPEHLMVQVIESVHEWTRPFVLTSRMHEYKGAVRATGLTVAKALIVRVAPMPVLEIITHLTAGRADADRRWAPVTAHLHAPGPLREVLSTPLMSSMARRAYTCADTDPAELLELDDANALEHHLFRHAYPHDGPFAWLVTLARYLERRNVRQLDVCAPLIPATWSKLRQRALSSLVFTGYFASIILLVQLGSNSTLRDTIATIAMWTGLMAGFLVVRIATRSRIQPVTPFHFQTRPKRTLGIATVFTAFVIVFFAMSASSELTSQTDMKIFLVGIAGISLVSAVVGAMAWGSLTEPITEGDAPNPFSAIRRDGWTILAHFPAPLLGTAVLLALQQQLASFPQSAALMLVASTIRREQIPGTAWGRWIIWSVKLARCGLPSNLDEALENARRHGILRVSGTTYRFQHAKVQDHLARTADNSNRPS